MDARIAVIHLECDYEEYWLNPLEEGWITQSVDQWSEWLTRPDPEDEAPKIDWLISLFPGRKNDDGNPDPIIKSWAKPGGALKDHLKKRCNQKMALVFCP